MAPGWVLYLKVDDFLRYGDAHEWITALRSLSPNVGMKNPELAFDTTKWPSSGARFDFNEIDTLVSDQTLEQRLSLHHRAGNLFRKEGLPSSVYRCFHSRLRLKRIELEECVNSWVREAWNNDDLADSFSTSCEYIALSCEGTSNSRCIFKKTLFVSNCLADVTAQDEVDAKRREAVENARRETEDLERLRKSSFSKFVYVMEDLRNGLFKIGKSVTPNKRERTLQSEVPEIALRFSIPASDEHEIELHDYFSAKRIRGEWFALGNEDILWVVEYLKGRGDSLRADVDYAWLGALYFKVSNIPNQK